MPYASGSDVAGYCQNILSGASTFGSSTSPTSSAVDNWLSSGCGVLEARLNGQGYSTPITLALPIYAWMRDLNALFAAARAELSRTNMTLAPGERSRGQVFDKMFWDGLKELLAHDLGLMGVSRLAGGRLYAGGTSIEEKDTWEDDSDRVSPRFRRGQFGFPGTEQPDASTASGFRT